jgi:hypothetical protein
MLPGAAMVSSWHYHFHTIAANSLAENKSARRDVPTPPELHCNADWSGRPAQKHLV